MKISKTTESSRVVGSAGTGGRHPRYVVLISGRGSNLSAILDGDVGGECVGVISSRADAGGLAIAAEHGVPAITVLATEHPTRPGYDAALRERIRALDAEWVVLAGFMRILSDEFVAAFDGRIVNVHPSLLPKFPGLHPHRQALEAGATAHGATVHFVTPGAVDGGPVIAQAEVPVLAGDDEASLAARVLAAEHVLYPATLRQLFAG